MFDTDEQFDMHALPRPPKQARISQSTAQQILSNTTDAIRKTLTSQGRRYGLNQTLQSQQPTQAYQGYVADVLKRYTDQLTPDKLVNLTTVEVQAAVDTALKKAFSDASPPPQLTQTVADAVAQLTKSTAEAASTEVAKIVGQGPERPNDVSCSMSLLSWKETSDVFGRRVANTFIGIQVTVRNLNPTNEFLIHDIQVAVDTGLDSDSFSRFEAGRDKLLVRGVAERGQSEDRRNLALHSLQVIGAIAGSSSIAGSIDFKSAVAVFQGAFIPGYTTLFPDHTVDQLNHINDLVFSASSANKVLVPIQGSVPLVTFISEKPIEQMPFAWCGYTSNRSFLFKHHAEYCDSGNSGLRYPDPYSPGASGTSSTPVPPAPWDPLGYKQWKGAALRILQERTFVLIGGVHIKELTNQPAKITNISCPVVPSTDIVDISETKDGFVTCSVTGTNLDAVSSVALEKGTEKIAGKVRSAKDGNSADLEFDPVALSGGQGIYALFLSDKNAAQTDSGESVELQIQPVITGADAVLDLTQQKLNVNGKHLDKVTQLWLVSEDSGAAVSATLPSPPVSADAPSMSVTFSSGLISGNKYFIRYTASVNPSKQADQKSTTVTAK